LWRHCWAQIAHADCKSKAKPREFAALSFESESEHAILIMPIDALWRRTN